MVAREPHKLEVEGSTPSPATKLITMTYKEEQEFLERAFITEMLFDYGIVEVTTKKQYKNGTREFQFPCSTYQNTNEYYNCLLYTSPSPRDS